MRKFFIAIALLMGVLFLLARFAELHEVLKVFQRGNLIFLAFALLFEAAWIFNLGTFFQSVYRELGMEETRLHMMRLVTAAYFLTVVAPSAGLSAMAVYIADAQRRGRPIGRVAVATVLYMWFEYIGTLAILVLGLAELAHRETLHWSEITASLLLLGAALGVGLLLYLGMRSAAALGRVLAFLAGVVNSLARPFLHRQYIPPERAYEFSSDLAEGIRVLRHNPRWVAWPFLFTLVNKGLLVVVLACSFLAFKVPIDLGTLVAGQSVASLFLIISPTPAGIGIVEGALAVALKSLGIPLGDATVVTLAYRGFSFWLPFLFGMVMFRSLGKTSRASRRQAGSVPVLPGSEKQPAAGGVLRSSGRD